MDESVDERPRRCRRGTDEMMMVDEADGDDCHRGRNGFLVASGEGGVRERGRADRQTDRG